MSYREAGIALDLSSSGRGLQQKLLLLAYMHANRGTVLLLDEPDAHLEILRQRQIYQLLTDIAGQNGNQIIAASHSEILLNEASQKDVVVAFVGNPHRIDDRGPQLLKSLKDIGFEHYLQAAQTGWVLYLEGSTDLAILRAFAEKMGHAEAQEALKRPFVHYVGNQPSEVRRHFFGVREAYPDLEAIAIFDRLGETSLQDLGARGLMWSRREIENYLCYPEALEAYAEDTAREDSLGPLFEASETRQRAMVMLDSIREVEAAMQTLRKGSPWDPDTKVSDDFLTPLFEKFYQKLGLPNMMAKTNFHQLTVHVPLDKIDKEVRDKLDAIVETAAKAQPVTDED